MSDIHRDCQGYIIGGLVFVVCMFKTSVYIVTVLVVPVNTLYSEQEKNLFYILVYLYIY